MNNPLTILYMRQHFLILLLILSSSAFAQIHKTSQTVQGTWTTNKTIIDPKVGIVKLIRVKHDDSGHGTFIAFNDTSNFSFYLSPMNDDVCIWNYAGNYAYRSNTLSLKFNSYSQHGKCKGLSKSYKKDQMKFMFLLESISKDTLVLKRQTK